MGFETFHIDGFDDLPSDLLAICNCQVMHFHSCLSFRFFTCNVKLLVYSINNELHYEIEMG